MIPERKMKKLLLLSVLATSGLAQAAEAIPDVVKLFSEQQNIKIIKKIDAAVRVLNNIEVKQKQNLLNMGGVIDLLESVIVDLQKMDIEATLNKENVEGEEKE